MPSEAATRGRMKAFLPAKLIPTRLVARGHHGYFPRAPLRAQRPVLRPRDPRHGLLPHPIPRTAAESGLVEVDPPRGRRVRRVGGVPRIPRRPRGRVLFRRHDPEGEGVRASHLDEVEGTVRDEHEAARGDRTRQYALGAVTGDTREDTHTAHKR